MLTCLPITVCQAPYKFFTQDFTEASKLAVMIPILHRGESQTQRGHVTRSRSHSMGQQSEDMNPESRVLSMRP